MCWFFVLYYITLSEDRLHAFYYNLNALRDYFRVFGRMVFVADGCKYNDLFFFVQAEDGILDGTVTGVQTCALPICSGPRSWRQPASNSPAVSAPAMRAPLLGRCTASLPSFRGCVSRPRRPRSPVGSGTSHNRRSDRKSVV